MEGSVSSHIDIDALMERVRSELTRSANTGSVGERPSAGALYVPGTLLHFGAQGNAGPFLVSGWSQPESGFCWTEASPARLAFSFESPPPELVLSFTVRPILAADVETQNVSAIWDGMPIADWDIREAKTYHALLLAPAFRSTSVHILEFVIPNAFSPSTKNLGPDPRRLGLAFHELVLCPTSEFGF